MDLTLTVTCKRKGLSPVVATLLMVGIVFAMFAILYPWATSSLMIYQGSANIWFSSQEEAAKERVVIEMALFNVTTNHTDIYVRNVGEIDVRIVAVYVNGTDLSTSVTPQITGGYPIHTKASNQNVVRFSIEIPQYTYVNIKVVTARGYQATITVTR
ncbi:MAG: archaellin/type IV pilin N-terminal domain-containing protein [Candidatus Bathyarchaeia archaeon]